jgi:hypothetical protein
MSETMTLLVRGGERVNEPAEAWPWNRDDPDPEGPPPDPDLDEAYAAADPGDDPDGLWSPPGDAEDAGPWTGEGEAFAAGFLHRDTDGQFATGFASGGELDVLDPGPQLAHLAAAATSGGHRRLGESELIGVLCAWQRIGAWAAAGQAAAITALTARRRAQARERENRHLAEHVTDEVAAALVLTGRSAEQLCSDAAGLARLPAVHAALAAGIIDWRRAQVFTSELAPLGDHAAQQIAAPILPKAGALTTSQLHRLLRRAVLDHDPEALRKRAADAQQDAQVQAWAETSGNAALAGRELPEADVITADRRLTALARWLARHGTPGTLQQLRAAVFTALLTGRPVHTLLPPGTPTAEHPAPGPGAGAGAGGQVPAVTGTVNLTLPLTAWTGLTQTAGDIHGHGPAPADTCRDLAGQMTASPATRWCLTLTTPDGHPVAHACSPRGRPPPAGPAALTWAARLTPRMGWLETGTCAHPREEPGYRPSAGLAHLIRIRQPACCYPGCGRPATRCDLDHTIPYERGGKTCECNLTPLCRTHHRAKQAPRWHLTQTEPGHMTWTLPSNRTYQPATIPYPV